MQKLRTYPIRTNFTFALVLMAAGDAMAQGLEHHHLGDSFVGNEELTNIPDIRRLPLRWYRTHGRELYHEDTNEQALLSLEGDTQSEWEVAIWHVYDRINDEVTIPV